MAGQSIVAELSEGDRVQVGIAPQHQHQYHHNHQHQYQQHHQHQYKHQHQHQHGVTGLHVHPHRPDGQEEQLVHTLHWDVPQTKGLYGECSHLQLYPLEDFSHNHEHL